MFIPECLIDGIASADQYTSTSLKTLLASSTNNKIDLRANKGYYDVNSHSSNQKITCIEFFTPDLNGTVDEIEILIDISSIINEFVVPSIPEEGTDEEYFEEILETYYWDVKCQLHYIDDSKNIYPDYDDWKFHTVCNEYGNVDGYDCLIEELFDDSYLATEMCLFVDGEICSIKFQHAKLKPNSKYAIILIPTWAHNNFTVIIQGKIDSIKVYYTPNGLVYIDDGYELVPYQCYIDNGSSWDRYVPYVDNGSSWDLYN